MILSIIIVSYNTKELLEQCLESILTSLGQDKFQISNSKSQISSKIQAPNRRLSLSDIEVIIVDNNSTDGSQEYLAKFKAHPPKLTTRLSGVYPPEAELVERNRRVAEGKNSKTQKLQIPNIKVILNNENVGFSKANNQGVKIARGEYILFLNPDTVVYPDTLNKTIEYLEKNEEVGVITCRIELADGSFQKECHRGFPTPWRSFCHFSGLDKIFPNSRLFAGYFLGHLPKNTIHEIDAGTGAFMMTKKEIGDKIGWWDEDFFWYGEDLDFCYRIKKAGFKVIFYPKVKITHYHGASSGLKTTKSKANKETKKRAAQASVEAMRIFYRKHYQKKYPKPISFLVMSGINLLEKIRLTSVEKQFR